MKSDQATNEFKDVLVFFSYRSHKYGYIEMLFSRLQNASRAKKMNLQRGSLSDLHIEIKNSQMRIVESLTKRDLQNFDIVYFELWYKAQQQALAAATYLERKSVSYFSKELAQIVPLTKVGELAVMADNGISLIDSFMSSHREIKKVFKKQPPFAYPLIMKAADAYGGKSNFLVNTYQQVVEILDTHKDLQFIMQEFIPNQCDYRCLIFGGKIRLLLKRTRDSRSDGHLNNTSAGAAGEIVELDTISSEAQSMVCRAASTLNRSQFAGVDLVIHQGTGKPYILEVNQTPQIEIGAEVEQKMEALLGYMEKGIDE